MSDSIERAKQDFDGWMDKWDDALKKGIFGDTKVPTTSKGTSDESFFGLRQDNPTDSIDARDSEYWRAINAVADGGVEMLKLNEADSKSKDPPNPVKKGTEGKDQDLEPEQLGLTFSKEDLEELDEMKKKLHDLGSKVAEMDDKDYAKQIESMIKQIDELSDKLGRVYG